MTSRNAADLLDYLFDLLQDESAAFKALGHDVLTDDIVKLNQRLAKIEAKISDNDLHAETVPYLVIRTDTPGDRIYLQFWSTDAEEANKVLAGSSLEVYGNADVMQKSLVMLTRPRNGKSRKSDVERMQAYREAILTHGRNSLPPPMSKLPVKSGLEAWYLK